MDARIDPMDENSHPDLVDLIRRSPFGEGLNLFTRLVKLAHTQGQIDASVSIVQRVAETAPPEPVSVDVAFEDQVLRRMHQQ